MPKAFKPKSRFTSLRWWWQPKVDTQDIYSEELLKVNFQKLLRVDILRRGKAPPHQRNTKVKNEVFGSKLKLGARAARAR